LLHSIFCTPEQIRDVLDVLGRTIDSPIIEAEGIEFEDLYIELVQSKCKCIVA
jgi:hypothetical protein